MTEISLTRHFGDDSRLTKTDDEVIMLVKSI